MATPGARKPFHANTTPKVETSGAHLRRVVTCFRTSPPFVRILVDDALHQATEQTLNQLLQLWSHDLPVACLCVGNAPHLEGPPKRASLHHFLDLGMGLLLASKWQNAKTTIKQSHFDLGGVV
jgi:hypothetical protein